MAMFRCTRKIFDHSSRAGYRNGKFSLEQILEAISSSDRRLPPQTLIRALIAAAELA